MVIWELVSWNWQNLTLNHLHLSLLRRFYLLARRRWKPRFAKNPPKKTSKSWLLPRKVRHRRKQIKDIQHSNHANRDVSSNIFKHYHSLFSILRSFKIFTQYICAGLYFDSLVIFTIIIKNGVQSTGLFTYYVSQKPSLISEKMDCCFIFWKLMTPTIHWRSETKTIKIHTQIHTNTNAHIRSSWRTHQSCAIFFKSMGVKDIRYDIPMWHGGHGHDGQLQLVQATTTGSEMPSALGLVSQ